MTLITVKFIRYNHIFSLLILFVFLHFQDLPLKGQGPGKQYMSGEELLDTVQRQTLKYFTEFAHPISGMAIERSNEAYYSNDVVTTGGTGFGIMAMIAGVERDFITREYAILKLSKIIEFLESSQRYHGAWSHWYYGSTGKTRHFSPRDDGGDLVETSFLMAGLLTARQYFNGVDKKENLIREKITRLFKEVEWDWYTQGEDVLYWHWSPEYHWEMNHEIRGWNECLITYILAASSPTHAINPEVYHQGWANSDYFENDSSYYGITLPLGYPYGGPLFFSHYSFLGLDPRGLEDTYADYFHQNQSHALINHRHCIINPCNYEGYGYNQWGLTASDNYEGYSAHSPTNDLGVITPTAALSSFPYTPEYSMTALEHFFYNMADVLWGEYGFYDAYSKGYDWYSNNYLAIDQGPIVVMIENYRTGLVWDLFMSIPEVKKGLEKLGFRVNEEKKMMIENLYQNK